MAGTAGDDPFAKGAPTCPVHLVTAVAYLGITGCLGASLAGWDVLWGRRTGGGKTHTGAPLPKAFFRGMKPRLAPPYFELFCSPNPSAGMGPRPAQGTIRTPRGEGSTRVVDPSLPLPAPRPEEVPILGTSSNRVVMRRRRKKQKGEGAARSKAPEGPSIGRRASQSGLPGYFTAGNGST